MLLPPDLREWLPAGHLAGFVIDVVEGLDLEAIYRVYRADGHGRPAHEPAVMVALLLYAYSVGVRSSRAIERRCVEDVAFRVIAVNCQPDHVTIARFRQRHQQALSGLFDQVLGLCRDAGMLRVGTVAIDSTKLAADASMAANRTEAGLRSLGQQILAEAEQADAAEDKLFGDARGDELPDELADPATRKQRIKELLERARHERQQAEHDRAAYVKTRQAARAAGKSGRPPIAGLPIEEQRRLAAQKYNLTDPDSAIVRHRGMLLQGYNLQTAVADGQVILAARATNAAPDGGQLTPTLDAAIDALNRIAVPDTISQVLADGGYWNAAQISALQQQGRRVLVPPPNIRRTVAPRQPQAQAMHDDLADPDTARLYRRRAQIVEPVFAHIKHTRAITRLLRRGQRAVQAEIDLIATTHNLLKLYRHPPATA